MMLRFETWCWFVLLIVFMLALVIGVGGVRL